jgi:thymidylate kinase
MLDTTLAPPLTRLPASFSLGTRNGAVRPRTGRRALIVEFIGVTGVGKSTLLAAVQEYLAEQGVRVAAAEDAILARHGFAYPHRPRLRSALVSVLALKPFGRYLLSRDGRRLSRLACGSILRGMGSLWTGAGLFRNFLKRIGQHFLLENLREEIADHDVILCDEGVVHAAHNLFVHTRREPQREEIEQFGRLVPRPDVLVWVTAPTSQSAEVILRRGHSRVRATTSAARTFAEHGHAAFEMLASVAELSERMVRVDNTLQGAEATRVRAAVIGDFLMERLQGGRP